MITEKIRDMVLAAAIASTTTMGIATACSSTSNERFEERAVPLQDGRTIACLFWYSSTGSQEGGMHCHNYTPSEGVLPK